MANCKVGDLAIIVRDDGLQENLGITVQIVGQAGYIRWYPYSIRLKRNYKRSRCMYSWSVVALSSRGICYRNCLGELNYYQEGEIPDSYLMPLPKLRAEITSYQEQTLPHELIFEKGKEKRWAI